MNRKEFLLTTGTLAAGYSLLGLRSHGSAKPPTPYDFIKLEQSSLEYGFDGLEPYISAEIMHLHYQKHAAGYLKKLKSYLADNPDLGTNLNAIIQGPLKAPMLKNNLGGHFNHEIFWRSLSPNANQEIPKKLLSQIEADFGSVDQMAEAFASAASKVFGSGWAWLCVDPKTKKLEVLTSANQNNPLMQGEEKYAYPIIGIDVWEHAYYLQYQNRRTEYISNFQKILNWDFAAKNYSNLKLWKR